MQVLLYFLTPIPTAPFQYIKRISRRENRRVDWLNPFISKYGVDKRTTLSSDETLASWQNKEKKEKENELSRLNK